MTSRNYQQTRGTAIAVGHTRRALIAHLREINLPPIRPSNKLSNGVSQMQMDAAVLEIQRFEHMRHSEG